MQFSSTSLPHGGLSEARIGGSCLLNILRKNTMVGFRFPAIVMISCCLLSTQLQGGGKAMKDFLSCLNAFSRRKASVEVYVTKGADDVRSLPSTKDLSKYTCVAFLSGDSTMSECMQETLNEHGMWPYAPILHLPGGSANVIANEFFPIGASCEEIIAQYGTAKKGTVLKATGLNGESIFALQIFGAGMIQGFIAVLDGHRHGVYAVFGKLGLLPLVPYHLIRMATMYKKPALFNVFNSEHEAEGNNFNLGLNRLDHNMSVIKVDQFASGLQGLSLFVSMMSGQLGNNWKAGKLQRHIDIQLTNRYTYDHPLHLVADGTSEISLKADSVIFQTIPDAVSFWTP